MSEVITTQRCKCCCGCHACFETGGFYDDFQLTVSGFDSSKYWQLAAPFPYAEPTVCKIDLNGTYTLTKTPGAATQCIWSQSETLVPAIYYNGSNGNYMFDGFCRIIVTVELNAISGNWEIGFLVFTASLSPTELSLFKSGGGTTVGDEITSAFVDCKSVVAVNETWEYIEENPDYDGGIFEPYFHYNGGTLSVSYSFQPSGTWRPCGLDEVGNPLDETATSEPPGPESVRRIPLRQSRCLHLGSRLETVGCCDGGRRHACELNLPAVPGAYCQSCERYEPDGDAPW